MARPLTQMERDLGQYAQDKTHMLLLDVVQSFEIADQPRSNAIACIGSTLLRVAATIAVESGATRERWLTFCNEVFDKAQQAKKENDDA